MTALLNQLVTLQVISVNPDEQQEPWKQQRAENNSGNTEKLQSDDHSKNGDSRMYVGKLFLKNKSTVAVLAIVRIV